MAAIWLLPNGRYEAQFLLLFFSLGVLISLSYAYLANIIHNGLLVTLLNLIENNERACK